MATAQAQPVTIDADKMERIAKDRLVVLIGNVVGAWQGIWRLHTDRIEVYLDERGDRIVKAVLIGNVRITTSDCQTATAGRAEYYDLEQHIVLSGNARLWTPEDEDVVSGKKIVMYLSRAWSRDTSDCAPRIYNPGRILTQEDESDAAIAMRAMVFAAA